MTSLTGVGRTALGMAHVRARESARPNRLFDDPYAAAFAAAAPDVIPEARRPAGRGSVGAAFAVHAIIRTRFYDDYLLAAGSPQVVLLAAGLDSRAFRLPWPAGTHVFEVDLPDVLGFKAAVLADAEPACARTVVAADLREDWSTALTESGFDPARPTAWLVEGLLIYLSNEAADRLLTTVDTLSAPGSQVAFEHSVGATADVLARARATPGMAEYSSLWQGGLACDSMDWLRDHGWRPSIHPLGELAAGYADPWTAARPAVCSARCGMADPLLVVDAANVVGSVPDGWWRDRAGAATRLRDSLASVAAQGIQGAVPDWLRIPPIDVVLVVEGAARGVPASDTVRVVAASGSGDDTIVEVTATEGAGRHVAVVTADRELRARVTELGATVLGPRTVRPVGPRSGTASSGLRRDHRF
ncbi:MAG TPA: SAM-dependent methyltransferase [Pseudonocardiaceae bacterium]|nr:SAM-dependent methyltransferase [Pseudonocardiaceae bacterium]